jgi:4-deoxy-L-threo-5-hexosulose-uronate ketol-isomerase
MIWMMEIRQATNPAEAKNYDTERLRKEYLMDRIMVTGEINAVYSHHDRFITGGAVPAGKELKLDAGDALKTEYFLERREIGIINVGGTGTVHVEGEKFMLAKQDGLYIGLGNKEVTFHSDNANQPAKFYFVSALAHQSYPTKKIELDKAEPTHLGSIQESNERTIYKYIHGGGVQSCQLMLGMTLLQPNNMWNTMPAHIHDRRMEVYFYFDMDEKARVFHFMGEPSETRHIVISNEQAVLSPNWSIHSGVGTSNYTFIWAMAGENYTFTDMDFVDMKDLK